MSQSQLPEKSRPFFETAALSAEQMFLRVTEQNTWEREIVFALQQLRGNKYLQDCDPVSIKTAVVNIAMTGLTLNPVMQEAWLIPRKKKCCLDISYRGLIRAATQTGPIRSMSAQVVYEWDEFTYEQGSNASLFYRMSLNPPIDMDAVVKDARAIWDYVKCAFSMAVLQDGTRDFVILPKWKLWKTMQASEGKSNEFTPWNTWPEEMMRKTAIKYHAKTLPKTERLATAVHVLNEHEGLAEPAAAQGSNAAELERRFSADEQQARDAALICVCDQMRVEGESEWDCPTHGRITVKGVTES